MTGNENEKLKSSAIKPTKSQLKSTEMVEATLDTTMFQCPFCESRFMSKNNVISHIGLRHKNKDPNVGFKKVFIDGTPAPNSEMSENSFANHPNIEARLNQLESQDSSEDMTDPITPGGPPGDPGLGGDNLPLTPEKATSSEGPRGDVSPLLTPPSPPDTNYSKVTAKIAEQEEVWVEEEKCPMTMNSGGLGSRPESPPNNFMNMMMGNNKPKNRKRQRPSRYELSTLLVLEFDKRWRHLCNFVKCVKY